MDLTEGKAGQFREAAVGVRPRAVSPLSTDSNLGGYTALFSTGPGAAPALLRLQWMDGWPSDLL